MNADIEDDSTEMSFSTIYDQLLANKELILTIDAVDEAATRKGLASVKYKQQKKLKDSGLVVEDSTLEFISTPIDGSTQIRLHIILEKKASVKVHNIQLPDNQL